MTKITDATETTLQSGDLVPIGRPGGTGSLCIDLTTAINTLLQEALMISASYRPNGDGQNITVSSASDGIGFAAFPDGTTDVEITVETAGVYVSQDGAAPTSADLFLDAGSYITWPIEKASVALFIRSGSTDANVSAQPNERFALTLAS